MTQEQFELLEKKIVRNPYDLDYLCIGKGNPKKCLGEDLGLPFQDLYISYQGEILPNNSGNSEEHNYFITRDYYEKLKAKFPSSRKNALPEYMPGTIVVFDNSDVNRGLVYAIVEYVTTTPDGGFHYFLAGWHGPFTKNQLTKV